MDAVGGAARNYLDVVERIHEGIPWRAARELIEVTGLAQSELARLLGTSATTLRRHLHNNDEMDRVASDRAYLVARVVVLAEELFDGDTAKVHSWLSRPQTGLGDVRPVDIMDTSEGAEAVEDLLVRILDGGIA
jgi:putative toxin-antitoxin system antitoxin component (TIGR02293 family)